MLFIFLYSLTIILLSLKIYQTIKDSFLTNNLIFLILANYILNITVAVYAFCFQSIIFTLWSSFILLILAFFLMQEFYKIYSKYSLITLPYLFLVLYVFIHTLIIIFF